MLEAGKVNAHSTKPKYRRSKFPRVSFHYKFVFTSKKLCFCCCLKISGTLNNYRLRFLICQNLGEAPLPHPPLPPSLTP